MATIIDEYDSLLHSWTRTLRRKADKTRETYLMGARSFRDWLGGEDGPDVPEPVDRPASVGKIARRHVEGWLNAQHAHGYKPAGINNRYRAVQQFLNWLLEEGEITAHPMDRMKAPKVPITRVPVVPEGNLRKLLATCKARDFENTRDAAILLFFIDTGGRRAEIAGLMLDDLDMKADVAYSTGKGDRPRVHSFGGVTATAIERYLRHRAKKPDAKRPELWLPVKTRGAALTADGIDQMIRRRCDLAGIPPMGAHKFRHTMATEFLDSGGDEGQLMHLMGWSSRQMIARYTDTTAERRAVRAHKKRSFADRLL